MAWWLTIHCRKRVSHVDGDALLQGLHNGDLQAPAGVDYLALAEGHGIEDEQVVQQAVQSLRVSELSKNPLDIELCFDGSERPVTVHLWQDEARVREELDEARDVRSVPDSLASQVEEAREVVAIELGFSQLGTMSVVFAYEAARFFAQKGSGVLVDDEDQWLRVEDGAFVEVQE